MLCSLASATKLLTRPDADVHKVPQYIYKIFPVLDI